MVTLTREDVIRRWKAARQQKKETTDKMVAELVADYENAKTFEKKSGRTAQW